MMTWWLVLCLYCCIAVVLSRLCWADRVGIGYLRLQAFSLSKRTQATGSVPLCRQSSQPLLLSHPVAERRG
ncbi:hypothetical protein PVAP13_3KG228101 [Panicum virgatum]|uniref:Secreted protein n=1 Tax=Panicum virgatum TaxID=38727 RepID=A0A8T0UY71_PANVG|nr:hypothetical protein PVAP13_3KG228101 [Panicum virgatum]